MSRYKYGNRCGGHIGVFSFLVILHGVGRRRFEPSRTVLEAVVSFRLDYEPLVGEKGVEPSSGTGPHCGLNQHVT